MRTLKNRISAVALIAAAIASGLPAAAQTSSVTRAGSFAPAPGGDPYRHVESAARSGAAQVSIAPGDYRETFTLSQPVTLENATPGQGPVTIGAAGIGASTTLKVLTLNAHLFGARDMAQFIPALVSCETVDVPEILCFEEFVGALRGFLGTVLSPLGIDSIPDWQDGARAAQIGAALRQMDVDVVLLQEMWDPDLTNALLGAAGYNPAGVEGVDFVAAVYGGSYDTMDFGPGNPLNGARDLQNSGLLILSRYRLEPTAPVQRFYNAEESPLLCIAGIVDLLAALFPCMLAAGFDPFDPFDFEGMATNVGACLASQVARIGLNCERGAESLSSKSFIRARFKKGPFRFIVWNTHLQAGRDAAGQIQARLDQVYELYLDVRQQRQAWPEDAAICGGDFNIFGDEGNPVDGGAEYAGAMEQWLGRELLDAARNAPDWTWGPGAWTSRADNSLSEYFDPGGDQGRLDYVLAADAVVSSGPARVRFAGAQVVPLRLASGSISGPGSNGSHTDDDLTDHYGVLTSLELYY